MSFYQSNLEPIIFATEGVERSIYLDNLYDGESAYHLRPAVSATLGYLLDDCYRVAPVAGNDSIGFGDHPITVSLKRFADTVQALTSGIRVARQSRAARTIKCLFIGDSLTAQGFYLDRLHVRDVADPVTSLTFLGTQQVTPDGGSGTYHHEGHSGWTEADFSGVPSNARPSPFVNPATGLFDFAYYRTQNSIAAPDFVCVMLGINDIFNVADATSESQIAADIDTSLARMDAWITSIKADSPSAQIGFATIIPPAASQDAFGVQLGTTKSRLAYARRRLIYLTRQLSWYAGKADKTNLWIIPTASCIDTVNGFEGAAQTAFDGATTNVNRQINHVHPKDGYSQIGDAIYAALKCIFA